jgi:hypothetical protein
VIRQESRHIDELDAATARQAGAFMKSNIDRVRWQQRSLPFPE